MMYDHPNYMGNGYFFRRGEYADYMSMFGMSNCIRSCRMIPMVSSMKNVVLINTLVSLYLDGPFNTFS